ncbi:MAG: Uma2 family endonuclease [Gemmataceae bacterium]|nr:Uma2 family endonuclease [Gemmataceae bacterium]
MDRKIRYERTSQGELIVNSWLGCTAGIQAVVISSQLHAWAKDNAGGIGFGSSVGYVLPNGANRSPSASWVSPTQLAAITREQMKKSPRVCPYIAVKLVSLADSLEKLQAKMAEYIANGSKLGWLIDPDKMQVHVYRPGQAVQVLDNPTSISGDPELPGFVLDLEPVWRV